MICNVCGRGIDAYSLKWSNECTPKHWVYCRRLVSWLPKDSMEPHARSLKRLRKTASTRKGAERLSSAT